MHRPSLPFLSLVSLAAFITALSGCGDDTSSADDATGGAGGSGGTGGMGGDTDLPAPICNAGTKWAGGTVAFVDRTAEWGLTGVEGNRISVADYDGDGYVDIATRTVGSEPDDFAAGGVRRSWLMRNNGAGAFEDTTQSSGIRQTRAGGDPNAGRPGDTWAFADVDNDGDLDVVTGLNKQPGAPLVETTELLLNNGDGTFSLGAEDGALRQGQGGYDHPSGATFLDYNRDGFIDLFLAQSTIDGSPSQDRLYYGDGAGNFLDVTTAAALKTQPWSSISTLNEARSHSNAWSSAACDLNGDGNSELLAGSYGRAPNHLWLAGGAESEFTFTNASIASGYASDDRVDWTDNESARCWCSLHPTDDECAGVPGPTLIVCNTDEDAFRWNHPTDREPFRLGGNSGTTVCRDLNNDGNLDLITTEIVHWDVGASSDPSEILWNTGEPGVRFERPGNDVTGLTREDVEVAWNHGDITAASLDFDNDGWPDVYMGASEYPGNHGLLYWQDRPGHFIQVPIAEGIDHHRSHGVAVADFDRDGDLDLLVGHSHSRCGDGSGADPCYESKDVRLFENQMGDTGNYVQLSLEGGAGTNRSAIGARVTVTAGAVTQTQEVGGGHGHYGMQDDMTLHFGLGTECEAEVTVRWPDQSLTTETFTLPAGYRIVLKQGEAPTAIVP